MGGGDVHDTTGGGEGDVVEEVAGDVWSAFIIAVLSVDSSRGDHN